MTATDVQVRILMRERKKGRTQGQAAAKANLSSRNTVAKYEALELLPSQVKQPRTYRTRPDDFAQDWPRIEQMLQEAPELEAKALFDWLCSEQLDRNQYPDEALIAQARELLRRRDGIPVEQILQEVRGRLTGGKQGKPALPSPATMEGDAHYIRTPAPGIEEEDDEEIILREKA